MTTSRHTLSHIATPVFIVQTIYNRFVIKGVTIFAHHNDNAHNWTKVTRCAQHSYTSNLITIAKLSRMMKLFNLHSCTYTAHLPMLHVARPHRQGSRCMDGMHFWHSPSLHLHLLLSALVLRFALLPIFIPVNTQPLGASCNK